MRNNLLMLLKLTELAEQENIKVVPKPIKNQGYFIRFWDGSGEILVRQSDSLEERVKTIAHELGHYMHKHVAPFHWDGTLMTDEESDRHKQHEKEADAYMTDLLTMLDELEPMELPEALPKPFCVSV